MSGVDTDRIPSLFKAFQQRWTERDTRMSLMNSVVKGEWTAVGPDDEALENRSPNLVQVALEDTAESASLIPSVRMIPSNGTDSAKKRAEAMERLAASYMDLSQMPMLTIESLLDYGAFGFYAWTVVFDKESGSPIIERRDPRTCYPETGWRPGDSVRTCIFARELYVHQLPMEHQTKILDQMSLSKAKRDAGVIYLDRKVVLIELFSEDTIKVCALYQTGARTSPALGVSWTPVLLEESKTPGGICPVVLGQRPTLDGEPRGQFDQVVVVLQAHIRLMAMVLDYADQAVYSDVWVKDLVGQMSYGGGAYIQLGPQGGIGRVPPAVSSLSVQQELEQLVSNIHLGGRWPKTRPGEIDQAIASAKFVEATAGMMNTVIRTAHLVMKNAMEKALRIAFKIDAELGDERTIAGVLSNQQFLVERRKSDIDLKARVHVDYGIGMGRDPAQTMVLGIQGMQTGLFSKEFVQENFEGITDVARERSRIDTEQLKDMALAQLLAGLQDKSIPPQALVDIAKARMSGTSIFDLFERYVAKPQEEAAAQMVPSGLGGAPMQPGMMDPNAGGPQPPVPPGAADLMSMLPGGPTGVAPAEPVQPNNRLSVPLPDRGFASTQ